MSPVKVQSTYTSSKLQEITWRKQYQHPRKTVVAVLCKENKMLEEFMQTSLIQWVIKSHSVKVQEVIRKICPIQFFGGD